MKTSVSICSPPVSPPETRREKKTFISITVCTAQVILNLNKPVKRQSHTQPSAQTLQKTLSPPSANRSPDLKSNGTYVSLVMFNVLKAHASVRVDKPIHTTPHLLGRGLTNTKDAGIPNLFANIVTQCLVTPSEHAFNKNN
eukprot:TRINITY_DN245_c0_g1_i10.p2 TRINITY_DN245_c0_g1~~TRINITY_DN245_c0_g1_i10.p2  ORF type:complete len:141 (-),score=22.06 TRINITY_DN245_c0_g1_i10:1174-1596(-)